MKRLLLDTCAVIDLLVASGDLEKSVKDVFDDPEYTHCASFETMRELVVSFNNKKLLSKYWKTADDVIRTVENDLEIEFLPLRPQVGHTYANLRLNTGQDHRDPSDHIIIAHAITDHMPLLSSDTRFWYYRDQGLELIEY